MKKTKEQIIGGGTIDTKIITKVKGHFRLTD